MIFQNTPSNIKETNFFKSEELIRDFREVRFLTCLIRWNNLVETNEMESFKPIPINFEVFQLCIKLASDS
jgi:hypothetical protein